MIDVAVFYALGKCLLSVTAPMESFQAAWSWPAERIAYEATTQTYLDVNAEYPSLLELGDGRVTWVVETESALCGKPLPRD